MTNAVPPFERAEFEAKKTTLLSRIERIHKSSEKLGFKRRNQMLDECDAELHDLRVLIEAEWQQLLYEERGVDLSDAQAELDEYEERRLFDQALDLLPLDYSLAAIEDQIALAHTAIENQVGGQTRQRLTTRQGSVEDGLIALKQGEWARALHLLAFAGPPRMVKDQVQAQRSREADTLLEPLSEQMQAHKQHQLSAIEREQLRIVLRIGSGPQCAEARRLLAPPTGTNRLWVTLAALALVLLIGGAGVAWAMKLIPISLGATPTSTVGTIVAANVPTTTVPDGPTTQPMGGPAGGLATAMPTDMVAAPTTAPVIEPTTVAPATAALIVVPTEAVPTTPPTPEPEPTATSATAPAPTDTPPAPANTPTATVPTVTPTLLATEILTMTGVKIEYAYTDRIVDSGNGPQTRMRVQTDVNSERIGVLRNGDQVAVLRDDVDKWYYVRIQTSSDTTQVGLEGWIERWLVGSEPPPSPPPTPRPAPTNPQPPSGPRVFVVAGSRSHPPTSASGEHRSCVTGRVVDRAGRGIEAARLYVNNGEITSETFATVSTGHYQYCGLGGGRPWSVVLTYIPGDRPIAGNVAGVINVDGSSAQGGVVDFRER
jgi:hypothetical protein